MQKKYTREDAREEIKRNSKKEMKADLGKRILAWKRGVLNTEQNIALQRDIEKALFDGMITEKKLANMLSGKYQAMKQVKFMVKQLATANLPKSRQDLIMQTISNISSEKNLGREVEKYIEKHEKEWKQMKADEEEAERIIRKQEMQKKSRRVVRRIIRRVRYA